MAEFAYNNAKNLSIDHILFELKCGYHPQISYKKEVGPCSKFKSADKLSVELRKLMIVCQENLHHTQEIQKRAMIKALSLETIFLVKKFG